LEKLDGVSAAFVNNGITLLVDSDGPLDEAAVKSAIEPFKMKVGSVTKAEELPF
jgi:hypothetical protein